MNKVVVIGANGSTSLQLVRMLGEANIPFETILITKGFCTRWSKYVKQCTFVDTEQLIPLLEVKKKNCKTKTVLFVHGDRTVELLDAHSEKLKEHYILPLSYKSRNTTKYMDKFNVKQLAKDIGLNVLDSIVLNKEEDSLEQEIDKIEFPCITKAIRSSISGKLDIFICKDIAELSNAIKKARSNEMLVEKFLDKKNELCFQGIAIGGEVYIPIVITYIGTQVAGHYGGHLNISDADTASGYVNLELLSNLVKEIGYQGAFSIEFVLDKQGKAYFMEINMRFGSYDYVLPAVGFNVAKSWATQAIERNKIEHKTAIFEFYDFKHKVLRGHVNLLSWLKTLKSSDIYIYWNKKDPLPFLGYLLDKLLDRFLHKMR